MITKVKTGFNSPRQGWPIEYIGRDDMVTPQQLQTLTELIYRNIQDDDAQERWFSQIGDIGSEEADELIFDLRKGWQ